MGRMPEYTVELAKHVDEFWGLEPDASVTPPSGLFQQYRTALMEDADVPADHFHLVYAYMVVEHVADPPAFRRAVHRCLRPGGSFYFITPNKRHYFTRTASFLKRCRLDEVVLKVVRPDASESYHHPVQYRMNSEGRLHRLAAETGFESPQFVYVEKEGPRPYMRGPLRPVYHLLAWKRTVMRNPKSLVTMICRMRKPEA